MADADPRIDALLARERWRRERLEIRAILLDCGLDERVKWGNLCYCLGNANVAIFFGLKNYCGVGFFKGSLLEDKMHILHSQGAHSQAVRMIRFSDVEEITAAAPTIRAYVREAIELEKAGLKVAFREKDQLVYPDELSAALAASPEFKSAFEALTPGRRRGYNLYFSAAKQSTTRTARIEKFRSKILAGKGMNDR